MQQFKPSEIHYEVMMLKQENYLSFLNLIKKLIELNYPLDWSCSWLHLFVKFHFSTLTKDKKISLIIIELRDMIKNRSNRIESKLFKLQAILK